MSEKKIYKLSNEINFRICEFDDCSERNIHWPDHIKKCSGSVMWNCFHQGDIHLHCHIHHEIELAIKGGGLMGSKDNKYICSICNQNADYTPPEALKRLTNFDIVSLKQQAKSLVNSEKFKSAKLIRLDDYYYPEISEKDTTTKNSKYWMSYDVKETKSGSPLLILYLGDRDEKSKVQFFIEPETKKLSHDHKDSNPISVISRIEVRFKDGTIEFKDDAQ